MRPTWGGQIQLPQPKGGQVWSPQAQGGQDLCRQQRGHLSYFLRKIYAKFNHEGILNNSYFPLFLGNWVLLSYCSIISKSFSLFLIKNTFLIIISKNITFKFYKTHSYIFNLYIIVGKMLYHARSTLEIYCNFIDNPQ